MSHIKSFIKNSLFALLQMRSRLLRRTKNSKAIILPSAPPGSLGEAAMIYALANRLKDLGFSTISIVDRENAPAWYPDPLFAEQIIMPELRLSSWSQFAKKLQGYSHFFTIGADCIDGHYSPNLSVRLFEMTLFAHRCGCNSRMVGSSLNAKPHTMVTAFIQKLPSNLRVFARDPLSFERMKGFTCADVREVADMAFLLKPKIISDQNAFQWVQNQRSAGQTIIGINTSSVFLGKKNKSKAPLLVEAFAIGISEFLKDTPDASVLLLPHDVRGQNSDYNLSKQIHELIPADQSGKVAFYDGPMEPDVLKGIASQIDACFTCRMHLGIACLGSGVPIAVTPYQSKFEGLFQKFATNPPVLQPEDAFSGDAIKTVLQDLKQSRKRLKEEVDAKLPEVTRQSELNLIEL